MKNEKGHKTAVVITPNEDIVVLGRSQSSIILKVDKDRKKSYEVKVYADTIEEAGILARAECKKLDKKWMK